MKPRLVAALRCFSRALVPSLLLLTLAFLPGCAMGPNYQRPALNVPVSYRFAHSQATNSFGDLPWWELFKDPQLQELIRTALTNNYDLKQAVARVEQVRQQAVIVRSPLFPQIGYGGDVGRGKNATLNTPSPLDGATESSTAVLLSATWEIDLWGRIRRLSEAARAEYLATDEARRGVTITLISAVATAYFQLLELDAEIAIQRQATNAYAGTFRIFDDRRSNGVASRLETDRAAAALANAAAAIPRLEIQIAATENQLNTLLGRPPGPVARAASLPQAASLPAIPPGLPSDLLQRRPDVLAAEQQLIAANASIGASLANFYPKLGLTTFLGKVSPELSAFSSGTANAWNVGASLAGPIFQGGALRAQYAASKARFDEAKAAYEQTVLNSLQEVSTTLIAREKLADIRTYEEQAASALAASVELATQRYLVGKSGYFEVLQAQQELYPTQRAQAQAQASELIAVVQLYKALGGGWQTGAKAQD
jgi:multidrug efflux system outer membrane protein